MSKAIKELEKKKREELMRRYYEEPKTPPYAPPRMPPMKLKPISPYAPTLIPPMKKSSSNPIPAPAGWLVATLKDAIRDEELTAAKYQILADQLDKFGLKDLAAGVILIANDEREHKRTLENILRETESAIKRRLEWVERKR